jgi:hypothetical protein
MRADYRSTTRAPRLPFGRSELPKRVQDIFGRRRRVMRVMFWLYLVFVVCGLVLYTAVGLAHH